MDPSELGHTTYEESSIPLSIQQTKRLNHLPHLGTPNVEQLGFQATLMGRKSHIIRNTIRRTVFPTVKLTRCIPVNRKRPGKSDASGMKMSSGKVSPDAHPLKSYVPTHILGNHAFTAKSFWRPGFTHLVRLTPMKTLDLSHQLQPTTHCSTANFYWLVPVKAWPIHHYTRFHSICRPCPNQDWTFDFYCSFRKNYDLLSREVQSLLKYDPPGDLSHGLGSSLAFRVWSNPSSGFNHYCQIQARLVVLSNWLDLQAS